VHICDKRKAGKSLDKIQRIIEIINEIIEIFIAIKLLITNPRDIKNKKSIKGIFIKLLLTLFARIS